MSLKGRVKFTVAGTHPLLLHVRNHLIKNGFALVPWEYEDIDFCLIGAEVQKGRALPLDKLYLQVEQSWDRPVILLSSSSVYSDRGLSTSLRDKHPMVESDSLCVPFPASAATSKALYSIMAENQFGAREAPTLVIRPFNVYGPSIDWGVVHNLLQAARKQESLPIFGSGYQVRTFLHEEDFLGAMDRLVPAFLQGLSGVHNVGATEEVTIKRLGDSVWQLMHGADSVVEKDCVSALFPYNQWKVPSVTKVRDAVGWKPTISLRSGLFRIIDGD